MVQSIDKKEITVRAKPEGMITIGKPCIFVEIDTGRRLQTSCVVSCKWRVDGTIAIETANFKYILTA